MSQLPEFRRIIREDISEAPSWIERVITPINLFFEQTYSLFKSLTIGDNIIGKWADIKFTTPSDYATGGFEEFQFYWPYKTSVNGIFVAQIREDSTSYVPMTEAMMVSDWLQLSTEQVKIRYITGLSASTKYVGKLLVM